VISDRRASGPVCKALRTAGLDPTVARNIAQAASRFREHHPQFLVIATAVLQSATPRELIDFFRIDAGLVRSRAGHLGKKQRGDIIIRVGNLAFDPLNRTVTFNRDVVQLTPTETKLLLVLAGRPGKVVSRRELLECLDGDVEIYARTIDRHVSNLRKKLDPHMSESSRIVTVNRGGYRLGSPSAR
jgi:DNA-binding response OmpR family regulator